MAGLAAAFGSGAMTNSIPELEGADCIMVIGSNTTSSHPLVATRIFRAKQKGAKVVVIDPRRIQLALKADLFVRQNLGSDVALLNGIMHAIISRGWHKQDFVAERTEGFEDFRKMIEQYTPERASEISGVSVEDIVTIADWYANAKSGSIVYCMGITQHTTGVDNVKSLANLAMLTGHIGRPSTGVNPLRGQNNVQGACDMGGLPNVYPGYQAVNVAANKEKFEAAWNAKLSDKIGLTIPKVLEGLNDGSVKALYIVGENPMVSDPDVHHVEKALSCAELLVVQDIFLTPTAQLAHVVLPGASFAEKDGTFSNTERRVQRVRRAINPLGEAARGLGDPPGGLEPVRLPDAVWIARRDNGRNRQGDALLRRHQFRSPGRRRPSLALSQRRASRDPVPSFGEIFEGPWPLPRNRVQAAGGSGGRAISFLAKHRARFRPVPYRHDDAPVADPRKGGPGSVS